MQFIICTVPVAPIRVTPDHRSEMSSQFLFGETAEIIEENDEGWAYVKCSWDAYYGWCRLNMFAKTNHITEIAGYAGVWINEIISNGKNLMVPYGSSLYTEHVNGKNNLVLLKPVEKINAENIKAIASVYVNTAYCWGGRSVFGIDCSGFAQMVYKLLGIALKRDAHLQAGQGELVNSLQDAHCGDLAFFEEPEGIISHVGILLSPVEIIHASGFVHIDKIDDIGITNTETGIRTHKLKHIKRVF